MIILPLFYISLFVYINNLQNAFKAVYYIYCRDPIDQDRQTVRYCHVTEEKINNVEQLRRGDHISIDRTRRILFCGPLYKHHAIVLNVTDNEENPNRKDVKLIEFDAQQCNCSSSKCSCCLNRLTIIEKNYTPQEQSERFNGKLQRLNYHFSENVSLPDAETIIQNASSIAQTNPQYSLCTYNCEHFCHEACTGVDYSEQTQRVTSCLTFPFKVLVRLCFLGLFTLDDILWKETKCRITVPALTIAIVCFLYLIMNYNFKHKFVNCSVCKPVIDKKFCDQCKWNRKLQTALGLILLPIGQGLGLWLNIYLSNRFGFSLLYIALISVGVSVITFGFMYFVPKCCERRNREQSNMV